MADADHALKLAPANQDAIALRAGLYQRAGDTSHAIELLGNGVKAQPKSLELREVLAQLYLSNKALPEAEEQMVAIVKLSPQDLKYRKQLATFYARSKRADDAQRVLEDAVKALPKNEEAKLTLVSFVSTLRTREQAEKLLRGYIAQEPDNYELRFGLGELLQRAGAVKEALDTYQEIISRDGNGAKGLIARDRIAAIDLQQGKPADARKLVDEVLSKSPRDNDALLVRGQLELGSQDPTAAIGDLRAVLRDQPRSVPIQRLLAQAYSANGEAGLAEQALRAAMDVAPADVALRIELAQLLMRTARADQAVTLLEETVRNNPKDERAREMLVRADIANLI